MGKPKIKPKHKQESEINQYLKKKVSIKDPAETECFTVSLKYFDRNQSESFEDWEKIGLLSQAMTILEGYCKRPLKEQCSRNFTIYGGFPPPEKTIYTYPSNVPEDAEWGRIHINGTHILAGHVFKNIFYIVFLDPRHQFWISEKKHT